MDHRLDLYVTPPSPTGTSARFHRIDLSCDQTGFSTPPFAVHIKYLPSAVAGEGWTLLARTPAGKADALARWLQGQPGIEQVRVAPGLAPQLLRAKVAALPPTWAKVASFAKVHHLDLAPEGHATWFVEGTRHGIDGLVEFLAAMANPPLAAVEVRCRPVRDQGGLALVTPRQAEALAAAIALGYYEIPHRIDLRTLANRTGVSLGSISELLRRAEGAVLAHFMDGLLLDWASIDGTQDMSSPIANLLRDSVPDKGLPTSSIRPQGRAMSGKRA